MEAHLTKTLHGFVSATKQDQEALAGIGVGKTVRCTIQRTRNGQHHRKMFALLAIVLDNTDRYANVEDLLTELKLQVGHYEEHVTLDGEIRYVPKSIAFSAMSQDEFGVFYDKVVNVVLSKLMVGTTEDELEREVAQLAGFF